MRVSRCVRLVLQTRERAFWLRAWMGFGLFTSRRTYTLYIKRLFVNSVKRLKIPTEDDLNFFTQPYLFEPEYTDDKLWEMHVLRQNAGSCISSITRMHRDTLLNMWQRLTGKRIFFWIKSLFFFFAHKKYFHSFIKLLHSYILVYTIH